MSEHSKPVTRDCTKKILDQMDNSICIIKGKEGIFGFGFFFHINYGKENIPVMLTKYQTIDDIYLESHDSIWVSMNQKQKRIEFGFTKYINKEYDLSIIEIKENKSLNIKFIEVDEYLYKKKFEVNYFDNESIYIMLYNTKYISVSYGIINYIHNSEIIFSSYKNIGNYCCPIINLSNNKLIGIYKNSSKYYNKGIYLKLIINEFLKKYKDKTEIEILINIDEKDINKEIYFLNNYQEIKNDNDLCNDNLIRLNEINTELYINNQIKKFKKYFIPENEGLYKIKLKFNINITDCSYMFSGCENIIDINFISFNTKNIKNMKYMFNKCINLKNVNLFCFDTRKVMDMK